MIKTTFLLFLLSVVFASPSFAGFVVIVNKDNPISKIKRRDLKNIYRLKKTTWKSGVSIQPVNLSPENSVREDFSKKIVGKTSKAMIKFYLKRALSGEGQAPVIAESEAEMFKIVSGNKGAVGYASRGDGSVKIVPLE